MIYKGQLKGSTWTPLGTSPVPAVHVNSNWSAPWCCMIYGYFAVVIVYVVGANSFAGIQVTLYDDVGNTCTFATKGLFQNTNNTLASIQAQTYNQAGNNFKITNSSFGTVTFTVPNTFIAGMILPLNVFQQPPPASPCGTGAYFSTYYVPTKNWTIYEYVQTFASNNNYWASVYQDLYLLGGGYLGLYPNTFNPLNQINQSLPTFHDNVYSKNLAQLITAGGDFGYPSQCVGGTELQCTGDPTLLVCGNPGALAISTKRNWYVFLQSIGVPGFTIGGSPIFSGASDVPGIYALSLRYNVSSVPYCGAYCFDWFLDIEVAGTGMYWGANSGFGMCYSKNKFYTIFDISGTLAHRWQFQAFSAPMALPPTSYSLRRESYGSLANYHRAVSPDGVFQA